MQRWFTNTLRFLLYNFRSNKTEQIIHSDEHLPTLLHIAL
jgi:hypothetical protein